VPKVLRRKIVWIPLTTVALVALAFSFLRQADDPPDLAFGDVIESARSGQVRTIEVCSQTRLLVHLRNDERMYETRVGENTDIVKSLQHGGVKFGGEPDGVRLAFPSGSGSRWYDALFRWGVLLLLLAVAMYVVARLATRRARRQSASPKW
jgi:hypothetical protein